MLAIVEDAAGSSCADYVSVHKERDLNTPLFVARSVETQNDIAGLFVPQCDADDTGRCWRSMPDWLMPSNLYWPVQGAAIVDAELVGFIVSKHPFPRA